MKSITADDCVTELATFFRETLKFDVLDNEIKVYEYEDKPKTYKGAYIAINALPFVYGFAVNDKNIINLNIHTRSMSDGTYYRKEGNKWLDYILHLIPLENAYEDFATLNLEKAHYSVETVSQPMKDTDNTHYVNLKIKIRFTL